MQEEHPVILFDGVCNFCTGAINLLLRQDRKAVFRFATLQSAAGQQILKQYRLPSTGFDSFILLEQGRVYNKSEAALRVLRHLPWQWRLLGVFGLLPVSLRNGIYDWIARHRYAWFGKKNNCMIPTAEQRSRFLP